MTQQGTRGRKPYAVGYARYAIYIADDWYVLDAGSGDSPHQRANILLDRYLDESPERSGARAKVDPQRPFVLADVQALPFRDKVFDYIIASHVAEHVQDPEAFCKELMRVGQRGYIETPSKLSELLLPEPGVHRWYVYQREGALVFEQPTNHVLLQPLSKLFYAVFYLNANRPGHWIIRFSDRRLGRWVEVIVGLLVRKPWVRLRKWTYTCFEWEDCFEFRVMHSSKKIA